MLADLIPLRPIDSACDYVLPGLLLSNNLWNFNLNKVTGQIPYRL